MRRALLAALLLAGCGGTDARRDTPPPRPEALWPKPLRYDVDATWDERRHRLAGTTRISLRNTGPRALTEIWLRTWPNAFGSCADPLARVEVATGGTAGAQRAGCTAREIRLDAPLAPGAETSVQMRFTIDVPPRPDRFGRSRDVAYLGNALPTLAVADEDGWRLPRYFDRGESWFSLTASWRVKLPPPGGLTVAATGRETAPTVHEAPRARDFALAIGRMEVLEDRQGDIIVRHFRLPRQRRADARLAIRAAKASLAAFQRWYGPYGREELDIVQGPAEIATRGIAMEYPELILTPPAGSAVAHEVAHQWWAFLMGNDPHREPFLDESFAEFSASRLPRAVTGGDRLRGCPPPKEPPRPALSSGVPAFERAGARSYVRIVYRGGACMLRRLQAALGSARFDRMLRELVAARRDGTWTRAHLIDAIERAAPRGFEVGAFLECEGISRPG